MGSRHCAKCGEDYSDTYKRCPFCEEEAALRSGHPLRRRGGKRLEGGRQSSGGAGEDHSGPLCSCPIFK